jgi:hypothetical protein
MASSWTSQLRDRGERPYLRLLIQEPSTMIDLTRHEEHRTTRASTSNHALMSAVADDPGRVCFDVHLDINLDLVGPCCHRLNSIPLELRCSVPWSSCSRPGRYHRLSVGIHQRPYPRLQDLSSPPPPTGRNRRSRCKNISGMEDRC